MVTTNAWVNNIYVETILSVCRNFTTHFEFVKKVEMDYTGWKVVRSFYSNEKDILGGEKTEISTKCHKSIQQDCALSPIFQLCIEDQSIKKNQRASESRSNICKRKERYAWTFILLVLYTLSTLFISILVCSVCLNSV